MQKRKKAKCNICNAPRKHGKKKGRPCHDCRKKYPCFPNQRKKADVTFGGEPFNRIEKIKSGFYDKI